MQRTWLITGINRGLGRALTEALLARGDRVAGTARKLDELDGLKAQYGEQLWTASLDLTDAAGIESVVNRAFAELGRIDVVVNNAASSLIGAVEECPEEMIRHLLDTNLIGSILMVKAALPHLRAQGGGRILQISSTLGQAAFVPGISLYITSKWGIEGFIEATALDVAPFGIEMTIFEPGAIRTDFGLGAPVSPALAAYDGTPARGIRSRVESVRDEAIPSTSPGDPAKMAEVIIASTEESPAPKRVVMGSDSYNYLSAAYRERVASLEAQKELAFSTDF